MVSSTNIPKGSKEFIDAVQRLENRPENCANIFELAAQCCKLCNKDFDCDSCYVQTIGDLNDPYREEIQKKTPIGMYSSGIYKDGKGRYHYAHPQGSG